MGIVTMVAWTGVMAYICLKLIDVSIGLRVDLHEEVLGADLVEHAIGNISYDKTKSKIVNLSDMMHSSVHNMLAINPIGGPLPSPGFRPRIDSIHSYNEARKSRRQSMEDASAHRAVSLIQNGTVNGLSGGIRKRTNSIPYSSTVGAHHTMDIAPLPLPEEEQERQSEDIAAATRRQLIRYLWQYTASRALEKSRKKSTKAGIASVGKAWRRSLEAKWRKMSKSSIVLDSKLTAHRRKSKSSRDSIRMKNLTAEKSGGRRVASKDSRLPTVSTEVFALETEPGGGPPGASPGGHINRSYRNSSGELPNTSQSTHSQGLTPNGGSAFPGSVETTSKQSTEANLECAETNLEYVTIDLDGGGSTTTTQGRDKLSSYSPAASIPLDSPNNSSSSPQIFRF